MAVNRNDQTRDRSVEKVVEMQVVMLCCSLGLFHVKLYSYVRLYFVVKTCMRRDSTVEAVRYCESCAALVCGCK